MATKPQQTTTQDKYIDNFHISSGALENNQFKSTALIATHDNHTEDRVGKCYFMEGEEVTINTRGGSIQSPTIALNADLGTIDKVASDHHYGIIALSLPSESHYNMPETITGHEAKCNKNPERDITFTKVADSAITQNLSNILAGHLNADNTSAFYEATNPTCTMPNHTHEITFKDLEVTLDKEYANSFDSGDQEDHTETMEVAGLSLVEKHVYDNADHLDLGTLAEHIANTLSSHK